MKIIFLALLLAVADCITETGGTSQRLVCYLNVQATNRTGIQVEQDFYLIDF
jgi:hypothetical protein